MDGVVLTGEAVTAGLSDEVSLGGEVVAAGMCDEATCPGWAQPEAMVTDTTPTAAESQVLRRGRPALTLAEPRRRLIPLLVHRSRNKLLVVAA